MIDALHSQSFQIWAAICRNTSELVTLLAPTNFYTLALEEIDWKAKHKTKNLPVPSRMGGKPCSLCPIWSAFVWFYNLAAHFQESMRLISYDKFSITHFRGLNVTDDI